MGDQFTTAKIDGNSHVNDGHDDANTNTRQPRTGTRERYDAILTTLLSHPHVFYAAPASPPAPILSQSTAKRTTTLPTISSLQLHPTLEAALHLLNRDLSSAHFLLRHAEASPAYESMYLHGILHRIEGDIDNARAWYGDVRRSNVFRHVWGVDVEMDTDADANPNTDGDTDVDATNLSSAKNRQTSSSSSSSWSDFLDRVARWRDRGRKRSGTRPKQQQRPQQHNVDHVANNISDNDNKEIQTELEPKVDWDREESDLSETGRTELVRVLRFCEQKFGVVAMTVQEAAATYTMSSEKTSDIAAQMIIGGEGWREF